MNDWLDKVQEEIIAEVEAAMISPADDSALLEALRELLRDT